MLINHYGYGRQDNIIDAAFYNADTRAFDVDLLTSSSSRITLQNPGTGVDDGLGSPS